MAKGFAKPDFTAASTRSNEAGRNTLSMSGWAWLFVAAATVFLMSYLSITVSRASDSVATLWLPNAFAAAALLTLPKANWPACLTGFSIGVFAANLAYGDPAWRAAAFAGVNLAEVGAVVIVYRRVLGASLTHDGVTQYLRFLGLVVFPVALGIGLVGGALVSFSFGRPLMGAYFEWALNDAASLAAIVPFCQLVLTGRFTDAVRNEAWVLALAIVLAASAVDLAFGGRAGPLAPYFFMIPIFSVGALWIGRTGVIIATFLLLMYLTIQGATITLVDRSSPLGDPLTAFAVVFFCVAVSANLIATITDRLRADEAQQRDLNEMKTSFIASMSHEIKTPINAMHGILQLFENAGLGDKYDQWSKTGLTASRALQHQVDQYLSMARLDEDRIELVETPESPADLLEVLKSAAEAEVALSQKNLLVKATLGPGMPPRILLDRNRLTQIALNLISNAVKFSDKGVIEMSFRRDNRLGVLRISDEGPGVRADVQHRLFDRFWQDDIGQDKSASGVGLGLSISRELARRMGGDLTYRNDEGNGAIFEVSLLLKTDTMT